MYLKELKNKTCVFNDPLGQTHSPTSSDHYFHETCALQYFEQWGRTYGRGRTYGNLYENNDHYRPGLWVGRVDQYTAVLEQDL